MRNTIKYLAVLALGVIACEPEFDTPIDDAGVYSSGEADFSNYVALGNSLTAGFADNALYITGQENSYPNILAQQFALAGGGEFTQPLMSDNTGGLLVPGGALSNRLVLPFDANGSPLSPTPLLGTPTTDAANNINTGDSFNNVGVPGARVYHLGFSGYGALNPYFGRFASAADATIIGDAVAQNPTFFSLWIGNNDILGYATSGGVGVDHNVTGNIDPSTYSPEGLDITNNGVFDSTYKGLIGALVATGAKGVVLNLPDVTSLPFFTTVPHNPIPLDALNAAGTNMAYAQYNGGIQQALAALAGTGLFTAEEASRRTINFTAGQNAVVIIDEDLTDLGAINPAFAMLPKLRQATANDLLVLSSRAVIGTRSDPNDPATTIGVGVPLADMWVLTPEEQQAISDAQDAYNATIREVAEASGLAFVDVKSVLAQAADGGVPFDGGVITSVFATGGGFSLDGVHPTPRAHALVTNEIIDAIESTYGAELPEVNPGDFGTITISNEVN